MVHSYPLGENAPNLVTLIPYLHPLIRPLEPFVYPSILPRNKEDLPKNAEKRATESLKVHVVPF
jgi:hypothetical protein